MTDWWPVLIKDQGDCKNLRELVEAQNDVYMLAPDALNLKSNIQEGLDNGTLTRGQLQRNAINILKYAMNTHSLEYFVENGGKLNLSLVSQADKLKTVFEHGEMKSDDVIDITLSGAGKYLICVECKVDGEELAQFAIGTAIDNVAGPRTSVKGAGGAETVAYLDYTFRGDEKKLKVSCPTAVKITAVKIKK